MCPSAKHIFIIKHHYRQNIKPKNKCLNKHSKQFDNVIFGAVQKGHAGQYIVSDQNKMTKKTSNHREILRHKQFVLSSDLPLSLPTPQTRILTIGCE